MGKGVSTVDTKKKWSDYSIIDIVFVPLMIYIERHAKDELERKLWPTFMYSPRICFKKL